jgi:hypothetical protein
VVVREPAASAPPPAAGGSAAPPDPFAAPQTAPEPPPLSPPGADEGVPVPWERRAELGTWPALLETVKLALGEPGRLFDRMRVDDAPGAHLYYFLVACVPSLVGQLLYRLYQGAIDSDAQLEQSLAQMRTMGQGELAKTFESFYRQSRALQGSAAGTLAMMLLSVLSLYAFLYVSAGCAHLVLLLLGKAQGRWQGTFKAFVYGSTPWVFLAVPMCGSFIGMLWSAGLQILALARVHRTTGGVATAAVVGPSLFFICCCGTAVGAGMFLLFTRGGAFAAP